MKIKKNYLILAIDTSCDETSAAVILNDCVLSNVVFSQTEFHKSYGGVVPFLAQKKHQEVIEKIINQALQKAGTKLNLLNALAVTVGPGLAPALEIGIKKAKYLSQTIHKPLISVNHMEGHLLSSLAKNSQGSGPFDKINPIFPILGLLVSGGHTQLVLMKNFGRYQLLGETLDDAAGEAFDKVAKMLNLGYPGGPIISELAKKGIPKYKLPVAMKNDPSLNFSFSGLKTACYNKIKDINNNQQLVINNKQFICDYCASFEKVVVESIILKLKKAIIIYKPKLIVLGGGVISNLTLRRKVRKIGKKFRVRVFVPYTKKLFTDNAAMIGVCAWYQAKRGDFVKNISKLDRQPNLNFSKV